MPLPEKYLFTLLETALDWNKKLKKENLDSEDILSYGAEGILTICINIPRYCKIIEKHYLSKKDFKKKYPDRYEYLSDEEKKNDCMPEKTEKYTGNYLEPLQKEALEEILLHGYIPLQYVFQKNNPLKKLVILEGNYEINSRYPTIRIEDLRILREDKQNFEKLHLENLQNSIQEESSQKQNIPDTSEIQENTESRNVRYQEKANEIYANDETIRLAKNTKKLIAEKIYDDELKDGKNPVAVETIERIIDLQTCKRKFNKIQKKP